MIPLTQRRKTIHRPPIIPDHIAAIYIKKRRCQRHARYHGQIKRSDRLRFDMKRHCHPQRQLAVARD